MSTRVAQKSLRPVSHRLALEPRHLFDGAAPVTVDQHDDTATTTDRDDDGQRQGTTADLPGNTAERAGSTGLVIVDPAVRGWQELVAGLPAGSEVLVLDPSRSGLEQIADALGSRDDITTLHLVSHGSADQIVLGNQSLDTASLEGFRSELAAIGSHLSSSADILIYGCDVASQGSAFIDRLAALTGADVAASDDLTGSSALGGDWTLEASIGSIETTALSSRDFAGLLATNMR